MLQAPTASSPREISQAIFLGQYGQVLDLYDRLPSETQTKVNGYTRLFFRALQTQEHPFRVALMPICEVTRPLFAAEERHLRILKKALEWAELPEKPTAGTVISFRDSLRYCGPPVPPELWELVAAELGSIQAAAREFSSLSAVCCEWNQWMQTHVRTLYSQEIVSFCHEAAFYLYQTANPVQRPASSGEIEQIIACFESVSQWVEGEKGQAKIKTYNLLHSAQRAQLVEEVFRNFIFALDPLGNIPRHLPHDLVKICDGMSQKRHNRVSSDFFCSWGKFTCLIRMDTLTDRDAFYQAIESLRSCFFLQNAIRLSSSDQGDAGRQLQCQVLNVQAFIEQGLVATALNKITPTILEADKSWLDSCYFALLSHLLNSETLTRTVYIIRLLPQPHQQNLLEMLCKQLPRKETLKKPLELACALSCEVQLRIQEKDFDGALEFIKTFPDGYLKEEGYFYLSKAKMHEGDLDGAQEIIALMLPNCQEFFHRKEAAQSILIRHLTLSDRFKEVPAILESMPCKEKKQAMRPKFVHWLIEKGLCKEAEDFVLGLYKKKTPEQDKLVLQVINGYLKQGNEIGASDLEREYEKKFHSHKSRYLAFAAFTQHLIDKEDFDFAQTSICSWKSSNSALRLELLEMLVDKTIQVDQPKVGDRAVCNYCTEGFAGQEIELPVMGHLVVKILSAYARAEKYVEIDALLESKHGSGSLNWDDLQDLITTLIVQGQCPLAHKVATLLPSEEEDSQVLYQTAVLFLKNKIVTEAVTMLNSMVALHDEERDKYLEDDLRVQLIAVLIDTDKEKARQLAKEVELVKQLQAVVLVGGAVEDANWLQIQIKETYPECADFLIRCALKRKAENALGESPDAKKPRKG